MVGETGARGCGAVSAASARKIGAYDNAYYVVVQQLPLFFGGTRAGLDEHNAELSDEPSA